MGEKSPMHIMCIENTWLMFSNIKVIWMIARKNEGGEVLIVVALVILEYNVF